MEIELKQWQARKEYRENAARKERERRERVLAEVSVDPIKAESFSLSLRACKIHPAAKNFPFSPHRHHHSFIFQLRQEYGYDLDPLNPHYAEKIAEKEKVFLKAEKEEKKKKRAEEAARAKEEHKTEEEQDAGSSQGATKAAGS